MKSFRNYTRYLVMVALLSGISSQASAAPGQTQRLCEKVADLFTIPDGMTCQEARSVVVIATEASSAEYMGIIRAAQASFEEHFGDVPAPMLLIVGSTHTLSDAERFRSSDVLVLAWPTFAKRRAVMEEDIRIQVSNAFSGLSQESREGMVRQILAKLDDAVGSGSSLSVIEASIIQHELSHFWFTRMFDGKGKSHLVSSSSEASYGSSAPDWLDEMAAVMSEGSAMADRRRSARAKLVRESSGGVPFPTLAEYLSAKHPKTQDPNGERANGAATEGSTVTIKVKLDSTTPGSSSAGSGQSIDFYTQSRAFADFMLQKSGDKRVFRTIADHLMGGGSFQSWLSLNGERAGLPRSLPELEQQWQTWLRTT
jgi:hypothetical protein